VAVPVAPASAVAELAADADDVVCPYTPPDFLSVGAHYQDFRQTTDEEVRRLLDARRVSRRPDSSST
jgi:putative phosphoribosyl transferase